MAFLGRISEARQAGYEYAELDVKRYSDRELDEMIQMKLEQLEYARTQGCEVALTQTSAYLERVQFIRQRKQPDQEVFDVLREVFWRVRRDTFAPSVLDMYCALQAFYPSFYERHRLIMSDLKHFLDLYYYHIDAQDVLQGWPYCASSPRVKAFNV